MDTDAGSFRCIDRSGRARSVLLLAVVSLLFVLASSGLARAAAPANDNFADAKQLEGKLVSEPGSTLGATLQPGEPVHYSGSNANTSVWYAWTAPANGTAVINACSVNGGSSGVLAVAAYPATS